jgi:plasmid stability protein
MDVIKTIGRQIMLPEETYQAIETRARVRGRSVNNEIVALLNTLLINEADALKHEIAAWEAASDEDWLKWRPRWQQSNQAS